MEFRVVRKSDGKEVYRYQNGVAIEFGGFEFATHDHVEADEEVIVPPSTNTYLTKRSFWGRFPAAKERAFRAVMLAGSPILLAAGLDQLRARVSDSPYVHLQLAETVQGVNWLASTMVPETVTIEGSELPFRLTQEEAESILNPVARDDEMYKGAV